METLGKPTLYSSLLTSSGLRTMCMPVLGQLSNRLTIAPHWGLSVRGLSSSQCPSTTATPLEMAMQPPPPLYRDKGILWDSLGPTICLLLMSKTCLSEGVAGKYPIQRHLCYPFPPWDCFYQQIHPLPWAPPAPAPDPTVLLPLQQIPSRPTLPSFYNVSAPQLSLKLSLPC